MTPRHFANASKLYLSKDVNKLIEDKPNLWYAFTAVTGIDKIFSYTPEEITNEIDSDEDNDPQYKNGF